MFSRTVEHVAATKIFARGLDDGRQVLAYAMQLSAAEEVAMVLPIPVPAASPDDAVEMIDLSAYPGLFDDLKRAFPAPLTAGFAPQSRGPAVKAAKLVVHRVGAFDASFVPRPADFARLDPRFRLSPAVLAALPQYADWGFVVFQLGAGRGREIHPMAFRFPRRDREAVFFPTVHVHDGGVPATARFDHTLYAQLPPLLAALTGWGISMQALGAFVDGARAADVVDGTAPGYTETRFGPAANEDIVLRAPAGVALGDLSGRGPSHSYRVQTRYLFAAHGTYAKWRPTATAKLAALCAGLRSGLAELAGAQARAWQLGPLHDGLPTHFMNGDRLARATSSFGPFMPPQGGPGSVTFRPFTEHVEVQEITLGFTEVPSEDDARDINRALCRLLDRSVA